MKCGSCRGENQRTALKVESTRCGAAAEKRKAEKQLLSVSLSDWLKIGLLCATGYSVGATTAKEGECRRWPVFDFPRQISTVKEAFIDISLPIIEERVRCSHPCAEQPFNNMIGLDGMFYIFRFFFLLSFLFDDHIPLRRGLQCWRYRNHPTPGGWERARGSKKPSQLTQMFSPQLTRLPTETPGS